MKDDFLRSGAVMPSMAERGTGIIISMSGGGATKAARGNGPRDAFRGWALRAGVDIGGTFTDLILTDSATGLFFIEKALTTPKDLSLAVETVLLAAQKKSGLRLSEVNAIVHGTTLVTNALIERKGG